MKEFGWIDFPLLTEYERFFPFDVNCFAMISASSKPKKVCPEMWELPHEHLLVNLEKSTLVLNIIAYMLNAQKYLESIVLLLSRYYASTVIFCLL